MNTVVLMGVVIAVLGKLVGVAFLMRSEENATAVPFIVLVTGGYTMLIGGALAGGSLPF